MKTIKHYLDSLEKTKKNELWIDLSKLAPEFGFYDGYYYDFEGDSRLKAWWAHSWICTDTEVGLALYFFEGEFVAASFQPYRKSDTEFEWASQEAFDKVRAYITEIYLKEKSPGSPSFIDFNQDLSKIEDNH